MLLNYTDTLNDVFTLVHEMGHALHSYLSAKNQSVTYADYVIFVAEVASTCNEALLMQHLLGKTTGKKERAYLINYFLEQFRTTLYRQTMFAEFELRMGELSAQGETLTADLLSREYRPSTRPTSAPTWSPTARSPWSGPASPTSTTTTTCSSTPPATPPPSPCPGGSCRRESRQ